MKPIRKEIDAYIKGFDTDVQNRLYAIREALFELVPDADEALKYRMPTIIHHGNLIHHAAFKEHIGIYPLPHVLEKLKEILSAYKQGKGSIQFPNDKPLPIDVIVKIAQERIKEHAEAIHQMASRKK